MSQAAPSLETVLAKAIARRARSSKASPAAILAIFADLIPIRWAADRGPTIDDVDLAAAKPYRPDQTFSTGDTLVHPSFGTGVVVTAAATSIDVAFQAGRKKLAHRSARKS